MSAQRMANAISHAVSGPPEQLHAVNDQLNQDVKAPINPALKKAIQKANQIMTHRHQEDSLCQRNYEAPCPDGWDLTGKKCVAPISYNGGCRRTQSFEGATAKEKSDFAADCKASWPCTDSQCPEGTDYSSQLCPDGWTDVGNGVCESRRPPAADGCKRLYNFDKMTLPQKEELAAICKLQWPCQKSCQRDYTGCPNNWMNIGGDNCLAAPSQDAGDCSYRINMRGMSQLQKQSFAEKCGAPFPCSAQRTTQFLAFL
eukprot:TRINITY_DN65195_c0_g1_i1.p1 TRINITY_DN65195_c0_g1~~TRINITY_DN65195_c0_g1_i1.p1  ORF type:complete len:257 (-),score=22.50 TRINITY_DN65195_c0_g1_i1:376-1146(-)